MITIRPATKDDAAFIAQMVMMALHIDHTHETKMYRHLTHITAMNDTLYAWQRCSIACDGDICIGLCLAYDAVDYHERRLHTFSLPAEDGSTFADNEPSLLEQEDEAGAGEYYIDSLAVSASHRKQGIGKLLLQHAIEEGKKQKLTPTLLVDPDNTNAVKLYSSLGFHYERDIFAFGQIYHKYRWA